MRLRLLLVFAVSLGFGWPARLPAAQLVAGPAIEEITASNAVIRWTTDVATGSRVQFGLRPDHLTNRAEGGLGAQHRVLLSGLKPGARYYFTAGTSRVPLATNTFTTFGNEAPAPVPGIAQSASVQPKTHPPRPAPPTRETWGHLPSLPDHFERHGRDFNAKNPDDYARLAWEFLQRGRAGELPMKIDAEGVLRVFDPKTRAFGAYNRDGTTKTFFKPESADYFQRQPGRPIKAQDLKFR